MNSRIRKFALSAVFIAVAYVFSLIKIFHMPLGGSITLFSMLFVALPAYYFGPTIGFTASFAYSLLQLTDNPYIIHPVQLLFDYILPFTIFGIVGFFKNKKNGLQIGFIIACILRWVFCSISGYVFFKEYAPEGWNPIMYTIVYNGGYIFGECIITLIVILIPYVKRVIEKFKTKF